MSRQKFAYISFDVVPAPKGAATHILAFTKAIANQLGNVDLVTVAAQRNLDLPPIHPHIQQTTLDARGKYLIDSRPLFSDDVGAVAAAANEQSYSLRFDANSLYF